MNSAQVAEVLVVRAVEEWDAEAIPPEDRINALASAGAFDDSAEWFARRAAWLLEHGLAGYRGVRHLTEALSLPVVPIVIAGASLGLLTNYLGPERRIHVLYNPIAALVAWNLAVALATGLRWPWRRLRARATPLDTPRTPAPAGAVHLGPAHSGQAPIDPAVGVPGLGTQGLPGRRADGPRAGLLTRWLLHRWWPGLFLRLSRGAFDSKERARGFGQVARRFWAMWLQRARPALVTQLRRNLHWAALGLVLGAVAGMFVRGLFFEYQVIWRSTFLHDPEAIATLLRGFLGPAATMLGEPLPGVSDVAAMQQEDGVGAARWIRLYGLTAAVVVALPRLGLALRAGWRLQRIGREVDLDLQADYFERIRAEARAVQVDRITAEIESDVRAESDRFTEELCEFVCHGLYDARLAPRVVDFRQSGGRLSELEESFRAECEAFAPELEAHLPGAQARFEERLARSVEETVGVRTGIEADPAGALAKRLGGAPDATAEAMSRSLGHQIADAIGAAVSTASAGVAGAVSGGFGKVLGAAILVKLLGTTGPVGFLIGALGGAVLAVSAWWVGRDRVAARVKQLSIPGWVTRLAMPSGRSERLVAEGRTRCAAEVRSLVASELEPLTPQIADQIWTRVKPLLGELHQRRFEAAADAPVER